ncbi:putative pectinesterase/pectinesterase inhibitor 21 [Vitis vinifera]|uniref:Putative pectinesterase/pectinesterase inhibitor 21 n=1 Tax=Vitis vinifera TaxID=29760 RepID=A0A438BNI7_VITVI|nr:putative pectinesterase/pectinesterase inhibitor 21 [Vitis vinifera]
MEKASCSPRLLAPEVAEKGGNSLFPLNLSLRLLVGEEAVWLQSPVGERGINKGTKMIGKAVVSGISLILVVGVIIGIVSVTRPHGSDRNDGNTNMSSSMKAVASVCATADYKDACMQTLSPVAKNGSATPKDYIQAAVQVTMKEIKSSMNLSEKLVQATNDSRTQMALGDCKDLLQFAIDELQESFSSVGESDLQTLDQLSTEIMNWLSAVVSYQQTCLDGVIEPRFQTAMQKGLLNATQLTSNALAIVSDISQILTKFNVSLDLKPTPEGFSEKLTYLAMMGIPPGSQPRTESFWLYMTTAG